jgi:hypothetical protein
MKGIFYCEKNCKYKKGLGSAHPALYSTVLKTSYSITEVYIYCIYIYIYIYIYIHI